MKKLAAFLAMALAVICLAEASSAANYDKPFDKLGATTVEIAENYGTEALKGIYTYSSMEDFRRDFKENSRFKDMESSADDAQKIMYKNYANIYLYFHMPLGYSTEDILEVKFDEAALSPGLRVEVIFKNRAFLTYAYGADGKEPGAYILFDEPVGSRDYRDVGSVALDEVYCGSGFTASQPMIPRPMEKLAADELSERVDD